jgi:hypothetical protein
LFCSGVYFYGCEGVNCMRAFFLILAVLLLLSGKLDGQAVDECGCNAILILNTERIQYTDNTRLHFLNIIDERSYEQLQHGGSLNATVPLAELPVPIQGSASYSDFQEKRRSLFQQKNFDFTREQSLNSLQSNLRDSQVQAWQTCKQECGRSGILNCSILSSDEGTAVVLVRWQPAGSTTGKVTSSQVSGATVAELFPVGTEFVTGEARTIILDRTPAQRLQFALNIGGYSCSRSVAAPLPPPPPVAPTPCPAPEDSRCEGTISVVTTPVALSGCPFSAAAAPADVQLGKVSWLKVFADGETYERAPMTSGQTLAFSSRGKRWVAILGALSSAEPYPVNVTFQRACP